MSAVSPIRFARVIANSVHECAPDHSTHVINVGELREAVVEMTELYEALEIAAALIGAPGDFRELEDDDEIEHVVNVRIGHVKQFLAALAKARGES